jgi:hypothetical protein
LDLNCLLTLPHFLKLNNGYPLQRGSLIATLSAMKRILFLMVCMIFLHTVCGAQNKSMKPLSVLLENQQKGWDVIMQWSSNARNKIRILPKEDLRADSVLYKTQLFASSPLGAVVYGCGGILIEDGWIRILGSGCKQFDRSIFDWNKGKSCVKFKDQSCYLLVGDDIIGGMYGMKTSGTDEIETGKIFYFGPNSLRWEATGLSYTGFINFCFSGNLESFYEDFRWHSWKDDIQKMSGDQVVSFYPLLWTKEGKEIKVNRKIVSIQKQWEMYHPQIKSETNPLASTSKSKPAKKTVKQSDKNLVYRRP